MIHRLLTTKGNRLETLLSSGQSPDQIITDLYWTTLTRPPSSEELSITVHVLEKASDRRAALEDITWSLLNSNEFLLRR